MVQVLQLWAPARSIGDLLSGILDKPTIVLPPPLSVISHDSRTVWNKMFLFWFTALGATLVFHRLDLTSDVAHRAIFEADAFHSFVYLTYLLSYSTASTVLEFSCFKTELVRDYCFILAAAQRTDYRYRAKFRVRSTEYRVTYPSGWSKDKDAEDQRRR